ncbi:MAG: hypothetical protein RL092_2041, partial [Bacteroidota bacterium]
EQYANAMNLDLEPIGFYMTSTAYLDGLGRPIQKVLRNASGGNDPKDVMQFKQYNQYGISQKSYLPYVRFNSSHGYRANFIQESLQFYANQSGIAHTSEPYAESRIKAEPNHSVQEMGGVGSDFNLVSGHTTKLSVLLNSAEEVRLWQLNSSGEYDGNSFWPAGSLTKQVITDPNNKTSEVFTDVFGRTILSRRLVQVSGVEEGRAYTAGVGIRTENASFLNDQVFADHYYIYDGFDRLIIEIPPLFVEEMNSTGVWIFGTIEGQTNAASFLGYATGILYDGKGRVTESHSPNGGWSYNVYNQRDELVMSQNVEQRSENQWSFLRYDKYGRVVLTGVTTLEGPVERAVLQDQWDAVAENLNEVRNGVATTHGYTQNAPIPGEQDILTVNYFDDLNFDTQNATPQNQFQPTVLTKLKLTGSKVKVVGTENYLVSVNYYDKKGRLSQAYNSNFFGGYEYRLVEYDFLNKPINAERKILNLETNAMLNVRNEFEYDAAGRLKKIFQRTGPVSEPMIQLVAFEYNALGQLHKKHLYKTASEVHAMQIIDYRYNIQGWLTKINNSNLEDDGDNMESDDVFGEELLYTKSDYSGNTFMDSCEPRPTEMFNGLPSAMKWNVNASFDPHDYLLTEDGTTIPENAYVFRYDDLYRLTDASYAKEDLTADGDSEDCLGNYGAFEADLDHYSEFLSYDLGGNILQLKRYTGNAGIAEVMDNLHYKYIDHTNLLKRVDETSPYLASSGASHSQYQETAGLLVEFDYNKKGSITSNFEKGLSFKYNKIGLTASVSKVGETQDVHYLYAATGEKISKVIGEKEWFYVNGVEYLKENNIIKLIQVATMEGAVRPTPDGAQNSEDFVYDYYITDHLGNTRVIVSTENAVPISVLATHEYEHVLEEISYFDGVIEPASPRPVEWPNSQELNNIVAKLSSTGRTIGPSRLISVRANDKMKVEVESFYSSSEQSTGQTQSIGQIFGSILLNLMTQGQGVIPGGENGLQLFTQANSAPVGSLQNFLLNTSELNTDKPDAYLVYIFFDMNLNVVKQQSGVIPVGDPDALAKLAKDWEVAAQHGYFYTYVTNRNSRSVYFNNLKVDHQRGSVKQIFNYYPYGLMWENPTEQ